MAEKKPLGDMYNRAGGQNCACTTALGGQPIHVQDFAELTLQEAESGEQHRIVIATGPETYTFRELSHARSSRQNRYFTCGVSAC